MRGGKLWPVITITDKLDSLFPTPFVQRQQVLSSPSRLVIHASREEPPGNVVQNKCEVLRWGTASHTFVTVANEEREYCNSKTGRPVKGKSYSSGLPVYP